MSIAGVLNQLVADAQAVGANATRDPQMVLPLLAKDSPLVYVDAPTVSGVGVHGHTRLQVPVHVLVPPPGLLPDHDATYPLLVALLPALRPVEPFTPVALQLGDAIYPSYRCTVERKEHP